MKKIKVAIAGIGNCASALVQGLEYYRSRNASELAGLMHPKIGDWRVGDIEVVAAFDIDHRKVGWPLEEAIFAKPNCTTVFQSGVPVSGVTVQMGPILDGVAPHMADYSDDEAFRAADAEPVDVVHTLREAQAEILLVVRLGHTAAVGIDDPGPVLAGEVVDHHVLEASAVGVDPAGAQEQA